jgi:HAD superfamily hydrolase (TIGR01549 family)
VLFDLDGTLYRQTPVRWLMAMELGWLLVRAPHDAPRCWSALRLYRRAHEELRAAGRESAAGEQIVRAAQGSGLSVAEVERLVEEWMNIRPLRHLRRWQEPGLVNLLDRLERADVRTGVLSDYPAAAKLAALGLDGRFSVVLSASDRQIGVLKPNPRGFLHACAAWRLPPSEVLMVGDRADADAAGADAAGMPCVIVSRRVGRPRRHANHLVVPSLERLSRVLDDCR